MCVICLMQLLQTEEVKRGLDGTPGVWDLSVSGLRQFCRAGERLRCHCIGLFTSPEGIAPAVNKITFNVRDLQLLPDSLGISVLEHIFHLHSDQGLTFFSLKWKLFMPGVSFVPLVLELTLKLRSRSRAEKTCFQTGSSRTHSQVVLLFSQCQPHWLQF